MSDLQVELIRLRSLPTEQAADAARDDQDRRWLAGEQTPAEVYLSALPAIAAECEQALVVVYGEVLCRRKSGLPVSLAEFQARFPAMARQLADVFALDEALSPTTIQRPGETAALAPTTRPRGHGGGLELLPTRIAEYDIGEELGRGGMGLVLAAHDSTLNREVAIKTLIPGRESSAAVSNRFVREAQITARLPHPGVPPVHTLGKLPDGTPFLAMKRIRGKTFDGILRERTDLSAQLPNVLHVLEQVCQTIGFAHSQGIVHRDLKPKNVMVGAFGEVQVMDWGLAKDLRNIARDPSPDSNASTKLWPSQCSEQTTAPARDQTEAGSILGTPAYMAPEQARGEEVDERSDVFSLGAMLTEILTGKPVFIAASGHDNIRQAAAGDLQAAHARLRAAAAHAELVELAIKCVQPQAKDRPQNGQAVADALAAYRAGVEDRLREVERQRVAAEAQAIEQRKRRRVQLALAAVICIGIIVAGFTAWSLERQASVRQTQEQLAEFERLERMRRAGDNIRLALDRTAELRRQALWQPAEFSLSQAERLLSETNDPSLSAAVAAARSDLSSARRLDRARLDRVQVRTKRITPEAHRDQYAAAFRDRGFDILKGPPDRVAQGIRESPLHEEWLAALDDWAHGDPDKSTVDRVLGIAKLVAGKSWRDSVGIEIDPKTLAEFLKAVPEAERTPTVYRALAASLRLGNQDGVAVLREGLFQFPSDFWLLYDLALLFEEKNELQLAAETWRAARTVRPDVVMVLNELGVVLLELGDEVAAEKHLLEAIRLEASSFSYSNLGNLYAKQEKWDEAIKAQREAVRLDPKYANARNNLGTALRSHDEIDEAIAEFQTAIELDPTDVAPRFNLGLALLTAKNDPQAAAREFREILRRKLNMSLEERVRLQNALAESLKQLEDFPGAVEAQREVVRLDPDNAEGHFALADALCAANNPRAAIPEYRKAIELDPKVAKYHSDLGVELRRLGKLDESIECQLQAIELDPDFVEAHVNLGAALLYKRDFAKAVESFRAAVKLDPELVAAHMNLGMALFNQGEFEAAAQAQRAAVKLEPEFVEAWIQLGNALWRAKDAKGAADAYRTASRLQPENAQVWFNLGISLHALKEYDEATSAAQEAARLDASSIGPRVKVLLDTIAREKNETDVKE